MNINSIFSLGGVISHLNKTFTSGFAACRYSFAGQLASLHFCSVNLSDLLLAEGILFRNNWEHRSNKPY